MTKATDKLVLVWVSRGMTMLRLMAYTSISIALVLGYDAIAANPLNSLFAIVLPAILKAIEPIHSPGDEEAP